MIFGLPLKSFFLEFIEGHSFDNKWPRVLIPTTEKMDIVNKDN